MFHQGKRHQKQMKMKASLHKGMGLVKNMKMKKTDDLLSMLLPLMTIRHIVKERQLYL